MFGANGAGKTTLLSTIAGLVQARSGSITLNGEDITKRSAHLRASRGVALVQEGKRIFLKRTVHENLQLGGYRLPRSQRRGALELMYERFPALKDKTASKAGSLSGGQQQMVAIAQALMPGPRVLLLDEPSAGLAPIIVNDFIETISRLKEEGMAIVLVEQLVGKAMSVADRVIALQQGKVVINAVASDVNGPRLHAAYLGEQVAGAPMASGTAT